MTQAKKKRKLRKRKFTVNGEFRVEVTKVVHATSWKQAVKMARSHFTKNGLKPARKDWDEYPDGRDDEGNWY